MKIIDPQDFKIRGISAAVALVLALIAGHYESYAWYGVLAYYTGFQLARFLETFEE